MYGMNTGKWQDRTAVLVPALAVLPLLAYPPLEWRAAAWLGLAPLLLLLKHGRGGMGTWLAAGWGYGVVFYAFQYAWLHRTVVELAGAPLPRFVAFSVAMLAVLALSFAVSIVASRWAWMRLGVSPYLGFPLLLCIQDAVMGAFPFGGVPWGSLAGTQTSSFAAASLVPVTGGAGLVLVLGAVNGGWARTAEAMSGPLRKALPGVAALGCLTLALAQPWLAPRPEQEGMEGFTALLVPGDFSIAGPPRQDSSRMRRFVARTLEGFGRLRQAHPRPVPELVIWPEGAVSGHVESGKRLVELSRLATLLEADFLLGSDSRGRGREFNSTYLVTGGTFDFRRYDKRQLVPFGEYVPWGFRWFFGKKVTRGDEDYTAGKRPPVMEWRGRRIGLAICFESILPTHMRAAAREGAQVAVVTANDLWLTPAARLQHLRLTALRGLEIGRDVLFVSNGGFSAHLAGGRAVNVPGRNDEPFAARPVLRSAHTPWVRWGYAPLALLLAGYSIVSFLLWRRSRGAAER